MILSCHSCLGNLHYTVNPCHPIKEEQTEREERIKCMIISFGPFFFVAKSWLGKNASPIRPLCPCESHSVLIVFILVYDVMQCAESPGLCPRQYCRRRLARCRLVWMSVSRIFCLFLSRQKLLLVWLNFYRLVRCRLVRMPVSAKQLSVLWWYPSASRYESEPKCHDIVIHLASNFPAEPSLSSWQFCTLLFYSLMVNFRSL